MASDWAKELWKRATGALMREGSNAEANEAAAQVIEDAFEVAGWQDIETAEIEQYEPNPRVLVRLDSGTVLIAQYAPNNSGDGSYSWFADQSNGNFCNEVAPTCWMPLSSPETPLYRRKTDG